MAAIKNIVLGAAERMVATQKTVYAAETEALEYMRTRFGSGEAQQ